MISEFIDRQAINEDLFQMTRVATGLTEQVRLSSLATVTEQGTDLNKATFDPILDMIKTLATLQSLWTASVNVAGTVYNMQFATYLKAGSTTTIKFLISGIKGTHIDTAVKDIMIGGLGPSFESMISNNASFAVTVNGVSKSGTVYYGSGASPNLRLTSYGLSDLPTNFTIVGIMTFNN